MATTILLVDDHAIVRRGLATMLRSSPGLEVLGEASTGEEALAMAETLNPDVVVLDVGLPDIGGASVARTLVNGEVPRKVLALSAFTDRRHVLAMLQAGALGYVVKDCVLDELLTAIASVAGGHRYVSPNVASMILSDMTAVDLRSSQAKLTQRELEVLQLLADGKAMKEAATELQISTKTVETHRRAIMEKLQLFSVAELTKHAIREGISSLD